MSAVNAAPITATDSLSQALKANIIPNQEYLLQVSSEALVIKSLLKLMYLTIFFIITGLCLRLGC